MTAVMIIYGKMPVLQTFFISFYQLLLTLDEGRRNWHVLKGFATDYHCAIFHDCSDDSVAQLVYLAL